MVLCTTGTRESAHLILEINENTEVLTAESLTSS